MNFFLIFTILFSVLTCASQNSWKLNPYLGGGKSYGSEVKVLLYEGSPKAVSVKSGWQGKYKQTSAGLLPLGPGKSIGKKFIFAGKEYHGVLLVENHNGKAFYINLVPEDYYLASVLGHEMASSWPEEALKAQAIVARTYFYKRRSNNLPYHVKNDTSSQVYGGIIKDENKLLKIVRKTRGGVLNFRSGLADVYFHSSCGGSLASSEEVWGKAISYLKSKKTNYCEDSPVYRWKTAILLKELSRKFEIKNIHDLKVTQRTNSYRVKEIKIMGNSQKKMSGNSFRLKIGATQLKSAMFGIRVGNGKAHFAGKGYGHGVGMCQYGARKMAEQGFSYKKILKYYFPTLNLSF